MIIDAHCHAGKGDLLTGPWDTDAPLGLYLKRAMLLSSLFGNAAAQRRRYVEIADLIE